METVTASPDGLQKRRKEDRKKRRAGSITADHFHVFEQSTVAIPSLSPQDYELIVYSFIHTN